MVKLFARTQEWILIPISHGISYPDRRIKAVCAHLRDGSVYDYKVIDLYHCLLSRSNWEQGFCQKPRRCARCPTEIQMEQKCFNNRQRRKMWIMTKWMALGPISIGTADTSNSTPGQFRMMRLCQVRFEISSKINLGQSMVQAWKALGRKRNR